MKKMNVLAMPKRDYFVQAEIDRLRVNMGFVGVDKKVIMVASSVPGEGKSYISISIWSELAKAGNRVCLVDADMRKSNMRSSLRLSTMNGEEFIGLSHYLAGYVEAEDIIYATGMEGAYIIPTLTLVNPSLLFEGDRLDKLIAQLRDSFDYVVIDTPPLGAVSDGQLIASKCDGCILVVRAHDTARSAVKRSIQQIEAVKCPLLGLVLNRIDNKRATGYYYAGYKSKGYEKYYTSGSASSRVRAPKEKGSRVASRKAPQMKAPQEQTAKEPEVAAK